MRRGFWIITLSAVLESACDVTLGTDEAFTVADGKGPTLELLTRERRLPESAVNIQAHIKSFQDTYLSIRFDAPIADARAFSAAMLRDRGKRCAYWPAAVPAFWPKTMPSGAQCLEDKTVNELPAITVTVVPRGATATVFVFTSSH